MCSSDLEGNKFEEPVFKNKKSYLKQRLPLSPTFFLLFLHHDPEEIVEGLVDWYYYGEASIGTTRSRRHKMHQALNSEIKYCHNLECAIEKVTKLYKDYERRYNNKKSPAADLELRDANRAKIFIDHLFPFEADVLKLEEVIDIIKEYWDPDKKRLKLLPRVFYWPDAINKFLLECAHIDQITNALPESSIDTISKINWEEYNKKQNRQKEEKKWRSADTKRIEIIYKSNWSSSPSMGA